MSQLVRILGLVVGLAWLVGAPPLAEAQQNPKLYVFTSGSLGGFPKAALQIGGQGNIDWAPVGFYCITHPKGRIIFDTANNDKTNTAAPGRVAPPPAGSGPKRNPDSD